MLSLLANQAPIDSDGIIEAWNYGLPEGFHGESPLSLIEYETEAKILVEASVWQDNLDRERSASLGTHTENGIGKQKLETARAKDGVCLYLYLIYYTPLISPAR